MPSVLIIGVGAMGAGIAQTAALAGWDVYMLDAARDRASAARDGVLAQLQKLAEKKKLSAEAAQSASGRLHAVASADEAARPELVIEAVVEEMNVKTDVLRSALLHTAPGAILATNTSSLSVSALGEAIGAPARTVGMHFFNPVPLMPLVEVIAGRGSDLATVDRVVEIATAWGKTPVRVKDTPGFIVNRVARGYYLEPLRMLSEGIAGVDEMDAVFTRIGVFRLGPFALMDLIGLDVNYAVSCSVWEQLGRTPRLAPSPIQKSLVESGHLGRKAKRGFYSYALETPLPAIPLERRSFDLPAELSEAVRRVFASATQEAGSITEQYIFTRTLAAVINEAALAVDEGVALESDVDTAMKLGTNYPDGPLSWAKRIGRRTVAGLLRELNVRSGDDRFAPAEWLTN